MTRRDPFVAVRRDKLESGSVFDATCQQRGGTTYCLPFSGVTHVLVSANGGTHVAFRGLHWHAP